ncbi:MAG: hypothetical protein AAEJ57_03520 [Opitutales bacterium]
MKSHPILLLLAITSALTFSCSGDFSPEGTYRGELVMEDGSKRITLELRPNSRARVKGLFRNAKEGVWKKEATGLGFSKDGVVATFDDKKANEEYRVVFKLQQADDGLILADLQVRLMKGLMLQSYVLKEKKPLLRRDN